MQYCSGCQETKPIEDFSWKNKSAGKRQTKCKHCHSKYVASHYQSNKQVYIDRAASSRAQYYKRNRNFLNDYKSNLKCFECGETHLATLDFHHTDPTGKEFGVANFGGKSITKIKDEIKKCIVLCANCHRKLHWNEKTGDPKKRN